MSQLTSSIRGVLETEFRFVAVAGEISNLRRPYSGHLYFTLKDETAQIKAVMFKTQHRYLARLPVDGEQVVCRGRISVYEPRGDYQIIVDYLEKSGSGELQVAFEQLKQRLAAEGLFEQTAKKTLPWIPDRIALITSPTGAAVTDFLKMAAIRFPAIPILICPVRVQGNTAAAEIVETLQQVNRARLADVIILCRGGGSLEDLWPFNEEPVARAIFASEIPVVSAVGHEIDYTIADFVADFRAPTPTAAAEAVMPDQRTLAAAISRQRIQLFSAMSRIVGQHRRQVTMQLRLLKDPRSILTHYLLRLDHIQMNLVRTMTNALLQNRTILGTHSASLQRNAPSRLINHQRRILNTLVRFMGNQIRQQLNASSNRLHQGIRMIETVNPKAVLSRGYAIVRRGREARVVRSSNETAPGQELEILLGRGALTCEVKTVHGQDK